jgi:predicted RNA binding protein YcfA (HicA-like mRNA interferase family)
MPKLPRDLSGKDLAILLNKFGYTITRQTGSHLRLTSNHMGFEHHITIPAHDLLKIGTLNEILKDISKYLNIKRDSLLKALF